MSSLRTASAFDMRSILASAVTERRATAAPRGAAATGQARPSPQNSFRTAALEDPGAAR
jgi:hypothetical protein